MLRTIFLRDLAFLFFFVALAGFGVPSVNAQEPSSLKPRVLVVRQYAPMDWQAEDSIGLIMLPRSTSGADTFWLSGTESERTIDEVLAWNRPDLSKSQRQEFREILLHSLVDASFNLENGRFRHVTPGGIEEPWVYFSSVDGAPTTAEFAKAGPDGDIIVLGAFRVRFKTGSYPPNILPGEPYIVSPNPLASWDYTIQVAIGWFK